MLVNIDDTNSEIIHYRARSIIPQEGRVTQIKAHTPFNPRLGDYAGTVFTGRVAQELEINPTTGGYDLHYADFSEMENMQNATIDLTNTGGNTSQNTTNEAKTQNVNTNKTTDETEEQDIDINTDTQNITPKAVKKKRKKIKSKTKITGKKRRQSSQDNNDQPPKKKNKNISTEEAERLFSPPGPDEKAQNLTNTSPFEQISHSNSETQIQNLSRGKRGSKSRQQVHNQVENFGDFNE